MTSPRFGRLSYLWPFLAVAILTPLTCLAMCVAVWMFPAINFGTTQQAITFRNRSERQLSMETSVRRGIKTEFELAPGEERVVLLQLPNNPVLWRRYIVFVNGTQQPTAPLGLGPTRYVCRAYVPDALNISPTIEIGPNLVSCPPDIPGDPLSEIWPLP